MRNRAKCKLCSDIIESLFPDDIVSCKCDQISISGGSLRLDCFARDFSNFLRVDDEGNEVNIKVVDESNKEIEVATNEIAEVEMTKEQKIEMVNGMLEYYDKLPSHALYSAATNSDLRAVYLMIKQALM